MKCPACNLDVVDDSRFCPNCLTVFERKQPSASSDAAYDNVIGYGTTFTTSFLGMTTRLRVVSSINIPSPNVDVVIYYQSQGVNHSVSIQGSFFENLLAVLVSIRQHTDLLAGAEFGFLTSFTNDHQAILFSQVGSAEVKVFRKKGALSGAKDMVQINIEGLQIERELNDDFFEKIEKLQATIEQAKRKIADKIKAYSPTKRR